MSNKIIFEGQVYILDESIEQNTKRVVEIIDALENNLDLDAENIVSKLARSLLWELQKADGYKYIKTNVDSI